MTMTMKNYYKCKDEHRQRAERNKLEDRDSREETWTSVQFDRSMAMGQTTKPPRVDPETSHHTIAGRILIFIATLAIVDDNTGIESL